MLSDVLIRLRGLVRHDAVENELDDELRFHFEQQVKKYVQGGVPLAEARRRARLEFGGSEQIKEECREARGTHFVDTLARDVRYGLRMLRKSPGFTAVAILTLALGIGANTAIFSVFDAVMLRSLPVRDPQKLVVFGWKAHTHPKFEHYGSFGDCNRDSGTFGCSFSTPFFEQMRASAAQFSNLTAFAGAVQLNSSGTGPAGIAHGELISGDFFATFGVTTTLGRPIGPDDDLLSSPLVAVLSYTYWQSAFGGDRSVIGRTVRLNSVPFTVVGVAEPQFSRLAPGKTQDFFLPLSSSPRLNIPWLTSAAEMSDPKSAWIVIVGRLKRDASVGQAQAAASSIFANEMFHGAKPLSKDTDAPSIVLTPATEGLSGQRGSFAKPLYVLMLAVGFVLLIACANVAGLALARSAARQKEMAVRLALGASRRRLARQLLTESLMVSVTGGALGLLLAEWGVYAFTALMSNSSYSPFPFSVSLDWRILAFEFGASVLTGIIFGLAPALRGTRMELTPALKENAPSFPVGSARTARRFNLGSVLVVAQVAFSILLLTGAGLLVRTLQKLSEINPGFETRNVLTFGVDPTLLGYKEERIKTLYRGLQERFAAIPGVLSASYSSNALLSNSLWSTSVHVPGRSEKPSIPTDELSVGPEFFSTMRIPLLAGRTFTLADFEAAAQADAARKAPKQSTNSSDEAATSQATVAADTLLPVIVNATFAAKILGKRDPIGQPLDDGLGDEPAKEPKSPHYQIIGVVGDTKYNSLRREIQPAMFRPLVSGGANFELRTATDPNSLIPVVRDIVKRVDADVPVYGIHTQSDRIKELLVQERLIARLSTCFGLLAVVLACIGLFGLLAHEVTRRTREIGIRIALGAHHRDVLSLIVGHAIVLAITGGVLGVIAAIWLTRYLTELLYNVRPVDPPTFGAVIFTLFIVAIAACYIPARRAMRVDPMVALRNE
jgi:predicted permease